MSEVIRYTLAACNGYAAAFPVTDGQSIHDVEELGTVMVMASDYAAAQSELAALREELADMQHWRDLALQFDNHRMNAMWHLKTIVSDGAHYDAARNFLSEPPVPASEIQQRLTAAEQRNSDLIDLIRKAHTWVDRNNFGGWDAYELRDQLAAALKPTESGSSE
jgi:hypothetical protein